MALAREMMQGGCSSGQAKAINGGVKTAISAAGTTLATATALTTSTNLVGTATALQGVSLPNGEIGDSVVVFNDGSGATIVVYPPTSSQQINQLSAGSGVQLANNVSCEFTKVTATRWIAQLSA